jgi:hypothetical protein
VFVNKGRVTPIPVEDASNLIAASNDKLVPGLMIYSWESPSRISPFIPAIGKVP